MNFRNTLSTQPSHFTDCFPLQWGLFPFVVGIVPLYNGENSPRNKKYGEFKLGKETHMIEVTEQKQPGQTP